MAEHLDSSGPEPPVQSESRRRFLARLAVAMVGGLAALLGVPAAAFVIGPSRDGREQTWISLGPTDAFPPGDPTRITTTVTRRVGFATEAQEVTLFIKRTDGDEFLGISDICTHLACRVRHVPAEASRDAQFFCPCHNGIFDAEGGVVSGPIPRPLDRFEMKTEDDQLFAKEV